MRFQPAAWLNLFPIAAQIVESGDADKHFPAGHYFDGDDDDKERSCLPTKKYKRQSSNRRSTGSWRAMRQRAPSRRFGNSTSLSLNSTLARSRSTGFARRPSKRMSRYFIAGEHLAVTSQSKSMRTACQMVFQCQPRPASPRTRFIHATWMCSTLRGVV